ncbi:hypothetical protein VFC2071_03970 [Listeria monocytogenes]
MSEAITLIIILNSSPILPTSLEYHFFKKNAQKVAARSFLGRAITLLYFCDSFSYNE